MRLGDIIDDAPIGSVHLRIIAIGLLIMVLEGVDIQIIGFAAPALIDHFGVVPQSFGLVFSAGLFGAMLGAALIGPMGDRWGRKPLISVSIVVFAIGTLITPLAGTMGTLIAIRFLASIGLGGVIPNLLALVAEYSPARIRATTIAGVATGQLAGGMAGGLLSGWLMPVHGWEPIFYGAGLLSLLLVPLVAVGLPESLRYLSQNPANASRIRTELARIRPDLAGRVAEIALPPNAPQLSVIALLAPDIRTTTLLLWLAIGANLFMTAFVIYWLPTLLQRMGMALPTAIFAVSVMNGAGILGGLAMARSLDRWPPLKVLIAAYLLAAASIGAIGMVAPNPIGVIVMVAIAGFFGLGCYAGVNMLAATLYPTTLRSAGIGWAIAFGKVGSIFGPLAATGGLAIGMPLPMVFLISAGGGVVAASALLALKFEAGRSTEAADTDSVGKIGLRPGA